ncbi:MAG: alkaline phosphatase family protein, partial [Blastocatellia bacterium]
MKKHTRNKFFVFAITASLLLAGVSCKQDRGVKQPKLVVVIVIDQFRYDFLERFKGVFGSGGFRRLMDHGAFMENANYIYIPTYTAPGHAAIFTGSDPAYDGIVGNDWYDRETGRRKVMVSDDRAKLVTNLGAMPSTSSTQPASPRILIGSTIGDQMRLSNQFKSKVIAISLKDRAAVLPGGKEANGAYWFDPTTGTFLTSDYYMPELPQWVRDFNNRREPDTFYGKVWERSLPAEAYSLSQGSNTVVSSPIGRFFPHTITGGADYPGEAFNKAFLFTPFASEYLAHFAKAAIDGESLGA